MVMRGFALISQKITENACGAADFAFGITICHKKWPHLKASDARGTHDVRDPLGSHG
ncbi:MAG: hypothetical protein FWD61_01760 [Phycisphaerales bacterium]|nr:hypothetical protein [Phycisphaerales bacterium]